MIQKCLNPVPGLVLALGASVTGADEDNVVDAMALQLVPSKAASAVSAVPDEGRKLLALRSY